MGSVLGVFSQYWKLHGGWRAFALSPYLWAAFILTLALTPYWTALEDGKPIWPDTALTVIPSLLGFALGGMAIVLAFSYSRVLRRIAQDGKEDSFFVKMVTSFFHFIVVQVSAIFAAVFAIVYAHSVVSFIGFWLFAYSLLSAVAVAVFLFHTARIFNKTMGLDAAEEAAKAALERKPVVDKESRN